MSEVVALDSWHSPAGRGRASRLHAHVAFKQGEFSTNSEFGLITFTVHLSEVRLSVSIPATEPIAIDPNKVYSGLKTAKIRESTQRIQKRSQGAGGRFEAAVSARGAKGKASLSAGGEKADSYSRTTKEQLERGPITVRPWHHGGTYSWIITPTSEGILDGEPWSRTQPLMTLSRTDSPNNHLDAAVYVEVKAKRDHLKIEITNFQPEHVSALDRLLSDIPRNNRAAAEACIRQALLAAGLETDGFENKDAFVTLARVQAAGTLR